jgi:hypothetical protein
MVISWPIENSKHPPNVPGQPNKARPEASMKTIIHHHCQTALFEKILPDFIRFSLLWISQQYFFYRARSSALRPTPNLENQVSVYMFASDKAAQFYPRVPGSLFVAFYDS